MHDDESKEWISRKEMLVQEEIVVEEVGGIVKVVGYRCKELEANNLETSHQDRPLHELAKDAS